MCKYVYVHTCKHKAFKCTHAQAHIHTHPAYMLTHVHTHIFKVQCLLIYVSTRAAYMFGNYCGSDNLILCYSTKVVTGDTLMIEHSCVPIKLQLQKQVTSQWAVKH